MEMRGWLYPLWDITALQTLGVDGTWEPDDSITSNYVEDSDVGTLFEDVISDFKKYYFIRERND